MDLDCPKDYGDNEVCFTKEDQYKFNSKLQASISSPTSACPESASKFQSWRVENYTRTFTDDTAADTGPSFTLRNVATGDTFECSGSNAEGACKLGGTSTANSPAAKFTFDPVLAMLTVTQSWVCGAAAGSS